MRVYFMDGGAQILTAVTGLTDETFADGLRLARCAAAAVYADDACRTLLQSLPTESVWGIPAQSGWGSQYLGRGRRQSYRVAAIWSRACISCMSSVPEQQTVRLIMIFSCFTGRNRYSDVYRKKTA